MILYFPLEWILNVIHDGLKDELDFGILQQNFVPKMLMAYHDCSLVQHHGIKSLIMKIIEKITTMATPLQTMIRQNGLLLWLMKNTNQNNVQKVSQIVQTIWVKINFVKGSSQTILEFTKLVLRLLDQTENSDLINELMPVLGGVLAKFDVGDTSKKCLACDLSKLRPKIIQNARENVEKEVIYILNGFVQ